MDNDILKEAKEAFERCQNAESDNRIAAEYDLRFARNDEQWPEQIKKAREDDGRPCLTLNKLKPIIRQVVNDGRMNKPSISVHPRDSQSDPHTAEIMNGLIRQIEQQSQSDAAYDTALEHSVTMGFGYIRVNTQYPYDDTFDQDIVIQRVADPFTIYGDPESTGVDSSDWNVAFVTETMSKKAFEQRWKKAEPVDWADYKDCKAPWFDGDQVTVAEYWTREPVSRTIVALSDGQTVDADVYEENKALYDAAGLNVVGSREVESHKVMLHWVTGAEVLESREWGGKYIPIIPVYGEEFWLEGRRHLQGVVRSAIPAQQNFNLWRSASTEAVLLAPIVPWVGPKGAFDSDPKWADANRKPYSYLEYDPVGADGQPIQPPQRTQPGQIAAPALQEALNASDDIKSITGIHDASLGARSNETSGKAIMARQREGDISTFHYIDNLRRAIQHTGTVILDLIPTVYSAPRVVRVLGEDGKAAMVPVNQPVPLGPQGDPNAQAMTHIFDLTAGKYDLTVKVGPSFTSQREEAATQMMELIRVMPNAAPLIGDLIAENLDWPGADKMGERLKAVLPPQLQGQGQNPELEQAKQLVQRAMAETQAAKAEAQQAKDMHELKAAEVAIKQKEAEIKEFEAETDRLKVEAEIVEKRRAVDQQGRESALSALSSLNRTGQQEHSGNPAQY